MCAAYNPPSEILPIFNKNNYSSNANNSNVSQNTNSTITTTSSYSDIPVSQRNIILDWNISNNISNPLITRLIAVNSATTSIQNNAVVLRTGSNVLGSAAVTPVNSILVNSATRLECIFSAQFSADNFLGVQLAGLNAGVIENQVFGTYFAGDLVISYSYGNAVPIIQITVTTASTTTATATLEIPNPYPFPGTTTYSIPLVTSTGATVPTAHTAFQIVNQLRLLNPYGIFCENVGSTINFVYIFSGPLASSTVSLTGSSAVVSSSILVTGTTGTTVTVPRSSWNVSNSSNSGSAAALIDYTKWNTYKISLDYIPSGRISWYIFNTQSNQFELVHIASNLGRSTLANTSLLSTFVATAQGVGLGSPNLTMSCSGCLVYQDSISDEKILPRSSVSSAKTVTTTELNLIACKTVQNYNNSVNNHKLILKILSCSGSAAVIATINVYKYQFAQASGSGSVGNGSVTNYPNWTNLSSTSILQYDTTSTTITNGNRVLSLSTNSSNSTIFDLSNNYIAINDSEVLVVTAQTASGSQTVNVSLSFEES